MYGFVPGSTTLIVDDNGYCRAIELATGNTSTAPDLDRPEAAAIQQLLPLGVSSRACAGYVQSGCRDTVTRVLAGGVSRLSTGATVMTAEDSGQPSSELTITEHELAECKRVNATGRQPVVFVHGLWLLPSSWDRWATLFEENGYAALAPGWPDDPETVEEAKAHPEVFAGKSIGQVADHFETIIRGLDKKPAVIGHSFGGLLTQILAGRGLAAVSVAIDPAQFRGVLPLPISALKSAFPVLGNPANRNRAIPLTYDQFRYAFANAVSEEEAKQLHETYAVPTAGKPLFQAAAANFNPGPRPRSTPRIASGARC
jgi:pimeloyl-ACP methyl ester carboxylesterase